MAAALAAAFSRAIAMAANLRTRLFTVGVDLAAGEPAGARTMQVYNQIDALPRHANALRSIRISGGI